MILKINNFNKKTSTQHLFDLFGLKANKITDYKSFIKINHKYNLEEFQSVSKRVFRVEQEGDYVIEINLIIIITGHYDFGSFHFYWDGGPGDQSGAEYIAFKVKNKTKVFKKKIKVKLN